jgi:hypothetical protein
LAAQPHDTIQRLFDRTLEVRGSIPLGSTRKTKGLAALKNVFLVVVVDNRRATIHGYRVLDLNKLYGITNPSAP